MIKNGTYLIQKKSAKLLMLEYKALNNFKIIFNTQPLCRKRYIYLINYRIKELNLSLRDKSKARE